jgi:hypothetical protein
MFKRIKWEPSMLLRALAFNSDRFASLQNRRYLKEPTDVPRNSWSLWGSHRCIISAAFLRGHVLSHTRGHAGHDFGDAPTQLGFGLKSSLNSIEQIICVETFGHIWTFGDIVSITCYTTTNVGWRERLQCAGTVNPQIWIEKDRNTCKSHMVSNCVWAPFSLRLV